MIKFAFIKLNKLQFETKLVVNKTKTRLVILALSLQVVTSHLNICFRAHVVRISGMHSTLGHQKLSYRRESAYLASLYRTVQKAFRYVEPFKGVRINDSQR